MSEFPILEIEDLVVEFATEDGAVRAVDGLSLSIGASEIVGLVGESGCGKSVTALALLGLVPSPPGRVSAGCLRFDGQELHQLDEAGLRKLRGAGIAMIFQEPMTALNPVFTVASQMIEVLKRQRGLDAAAARVKAADWLDRVGIPEPEQRLGDYPHELSGGMRQRVMIAMALACEPKLLIADEPTTALDVTIQAQVLELMLSLARETDTAMLLITHDLGVVAETCDRISVMYCGRIVEAASVRDLFAAPRHPYTAGLLASVTRIRAERLATLPTIPGVVPDPAHLPSGCTFRDRCANAEARCAEEQPELHELGPARVACHYPVAVP